MKLAGKNCFIIDKCESNITPPPTKKKQKTIGGGGLSNTWGATLYPIKPNLT